MRRNYEAFEPSDTLRHGTVCRSPIYPGVALHAWGWETQPDNDTEWTGYEIRTGRILCWMVGDDRDLTLDPGDLEPINRGDYCGECGQIGCQGDAYDRTEEE